MRRIALPTLLPELFFAVKIALHDPALVPAITAHVEPLPWTLAMLFAEQLSASLIVGAGLPGAVTVTA